jgi:hypothetical protein
MKSLNYRAPFDGFRQFIFFCRFLVVNISPTTTGELAPHHLQSPSAGGRQDAALYLKGPFETLQSPSQCLAAFGMMFHTLASVDHSLVGGNRTSPLAPFLDEVAYFLNFWRGNY